MAIREIDRYENQMVRGAILKILYVSRPIQVRLDLLELMLSDRHFQIPRAEIRVHLDYLAGKGYLEVEDAEDETLGRYTQVKLTPKGIDLLEGNIPADPGVRFPGQ